MNNMYWPGIMAELEQKWEAAEQPCRQKKLEELTQSPNPRDWLLVFKLVRVKIGRRMDGDAVEHYLKEFFEVPSLDGVTKKEVQEVIRFLEQLPEKETY